MKYDLGLIPMSAKPFHNGHYYLVQKAAAECHIVKLFIGTGNRTKGNGKAITGDQMLHLWKEIYEPFMPASDNIQFVYEGVPVRNVYETLDHIKEENLETEVAVYSGNEIPGYGNLVLIKHSKNWITAYAHLKKIYKKKGSIVKKGEFIGAVGNSGNVKIPQLHFEIRKGKEAVDPLKYLS